MMSDSFRNMDCNVNSVCFTCLRIIEGKTAEVSNKNKKQLRKQTITKQIIPAFSGFWHGIASDALKSSVEATDPFESSSLYHDPTV